MLFYYEEKSKLSGIYEIINRLNGKRYIGSAKEFKERWRNHVSSLKSDKHQNKHLQNSFNKFINELGNDNFIEFHIVEIMKNSTKEERLIREEFWINVAKENNIDLYNNQLDPTKEASDRSCHSLTPEETSKKHSEFWKIFWSLPENKEKKSKSLKERWQNEEFREKMTEIARENAIKNSEVISERMTGENNPFFGKTHTEEIKKQIIENNKNRIISDETRQKISNAGLGRKLSEEHKKILSKIAKEKGPIRVKGSHLNDDHKIKIGLANKAAQEEKKKNGTFKHPREKIVVQLDLSGNVIKEFSSVKQASKLTGINLNKIYNWCASKTQQPKDYIWKYKS